MTVPHWHQSPKVWDTLVVNDRPWPGVARLKIRRGRKFDRKESGGANGERQTFKGTRAADVDIEVRVVEPADFEALQIELELVEPFAGKDKITPVTIGHAAAAMRKVAAVQIEEIEGPDLNDGVLTLQLKCFEFSGGPSKANGTGTAKAGGSHDAVCEAAWKAHDKAWTALVRATKKLNASGDDLVRDRNPEYDAAAAAFNAARRQILDLKCAQWTPPSAQPGSAAP